MAKNRKRRQPPPPQEPEVIRVNCPIEIAIEDGTAGEMGMMVPACVIYHYKGDNPPPAKLVKTVGRDSVDPAMREAVAAWVTRHLPGMDHDEAYQQLWER